MTALQQCLADAEDGVINYAQNQCDQVATVSNYVELSNVNAWYFPGGTYWLALCSAQNVTVRIESIIPSAVYPECQVRRYQCATGYLPDSFHE